jgi:asparagine synthase (glutamine-hydrolysing)
MCGICGILDPSGRATELDRLGAMNETLRHRGPDDAGVWRSSDRTAALAQRRSLGIALIGNSF